MGFDLSWLQHGAVAGAVLLGTVVQASVGFGCGLFAIPLIVWAGVPGPQAIALVLSVILCQTAWNCWQHRAILDWKATLPLSGLRFVFMPLGVWALAGLNEADPAWLKQVIGVFLLAVLATRWIFRPGPRPKLHAAWTGLAGCTSGFLAGMLGMGGPPLVLWVTAHDWAADRSRSFLWSLMFQIIPLQVAIYVWRFGTDVASASLAGFAYVPVAVVGAILGDRIGRRMSPGRLRGIATAILALLALASIVGPLLRAQANA